MQLKRSVKKSTSRNQWRWWWWWSVEPSEKPSEMMVIRPAAPWQSPRCTPSWSWRWWSSSTPAASRAASSSSSRVRLRQRIWSRLLFKVGPPGGGGLEPLPRGGGVRPGPGPENNFFGDPDNSAMLTSVYVWQTKSLPTIYPNMRFWLTRYFSGRRQRCVGFSSRACVFFVFFLMVRVRRSSPVEGGEGDNPAVSRPAAAFSRPRSLRTPSVWEVWGLV